MVSMTEGRYEMKYALPLSQREVVLDYARRFIQPDSNCVDLSEALPEVVSGSAHTPLGYRVSSLYMDDARLSGYVRRLDGRRIRNRIRIRSYGDPDESLPVFLESKRKLHKQVVKHRVRVGTTSEWSKLPAVMPWEHLATCERAVDQTHKVRWCDAVRRQGLEPVCRVEYWRETFARDRLRLTIDHRVGAFATSDPLALRGDCDIRLIPAGWLVLELKYDGQPPPWMRRLVARFGLVSEPISKFALGVARTCRSGSTADLRATTPPSIQRAGRYTQAAK
jgi:hypothetical protein